MSHSYRLMFPLFFLTSVLHAQEAIDPAKAKPDEKAGLLWYDIRLLGVEGQGWQETKAPFDRFPAKAEGKVPAAVWGLSRHSAGLCVRFATDARPLHVRWTLISDKLAMPHMPATGVSGVDLYVRSPKDGRWQWAAVGQPTAKSNSGGIATLPAGEK